MNEKQPLANDEILPAIPLDAQGKPLKPSDAVRPEKPPPPDSVFPAPPPPLPPEFQAAAAAKAKANKLTPLRFAAFCLGTALRIGFYLAAMWLAEKNPLLSAAMYGLVLGDFVFRTGSTLLFGELSDAFYAFVGLLLAAGFGCFDPRGFFGMSSNAHWAAQVTGVTAVLIVLSKIASAADLTHRRWRDVF
jgi:hypothetical protein